MLVGFYILYVAILLSLTPYLLLLKPPAGHYLVVPLTMSLVLIIRFSIL